MSINFFMNEEDKFVTNYDNVKIYPSVHSANGGQTHSEENIRWLSRQFTKKPFVVDINSDKDSAYLNISANAGYGEYVNSGLANIDGYLVKLADSAPDTAFDNDSTKYFQIITTQKMQYMIRQFMNNVNNELDNILYDVFSKTGESDTVYLLTNSEPSDWTELKKIETPITLEDGSTDTFVTFARGYTFYYIEKENTGTEDNPAPEYIQVKDIQDKEQKTIPIWTPNTYYKKCTGLTYDDAVHKDGDNSIWSFVVDQAKTAPYPVGEVTITYENKSVFGNNLYKELTDPSSTVHKRYISYDTSKRTDSGTAITIKYTVYYGISDSIMAITTPIIFFEDVFGFVYCYDNIHTMTSTCYPGNNLLYSDMTGKSTSVYDCVADNRNAIQTRTLPNTIIDMTSLYSVTGTLTDPDIDGSKVNLNKRDLSIDKVTAAVDTVNINLSSPNAIAELLHLNYKTNKDLYAVYSDYDDLPAKNFLNVRDYYFCLNIPDELCKRIGDKIIPVLFISADGNLNPKSLFVPGDSGLGIADKLLAEGYVDWFKRICIKAFETAGISSIDGISTGEFNNMKSDYNHNKWPKLLSYWAIHNDSFIVGADTTYTFDNIYNSYIAPFINLYMQIAQSALWEYVLTDANSSKYKINKAGNAVKSKIGRNTKTDSYEVTEDDEIGIRININTPRYSPVTGTNEIVAHEVYMQKSTQTENKRFRQYAHKHYAIDIEHNRTAESDSLVKLSDTLQKTNKLFSSTESIKLNDYEDFINYIKRCSNGKKEYNNIPNDKVYCPKYRITSIPKNADSPIATVNCVLDNVTGAEKGYLYYIYLDCNSLMPAVDSLHNYKKHTNDFNIMLDTIVTLDNNGGGQYRYISGLTATYYIYCWTCQLPIIFNLYKDSQNHINGRHLSIENKHAGIKWDAKLPCDIQDNDAWFFNIRLQNIRATSAFDIENNLSYSSLYHKFNKYMQHRRKSMIHFNKLYGNNFETLDDHISSIYETKAKDLTTTVTDNEENIRIINKTLETYEITMPTEEDIQNNAVFTLPVITNLLTAFFRLGNLEWKAIYELSKSCTAEILKKVLKIGDSKEITIVQGADRSSTVKRDAYLVDIRPYTYIQEDLDGNKVKTKCSELIFMVPSICPNIDDLSGYDSTSADYHYTISYSSDYITSESDTATTPDYLKHPPKGTFIGYNTNPIRAFLNGKYCNKNSSKPVYRSNYTAENNTDCIFTRLPEDLQYVIALKNTSYEFVHQLDMVNPENIPGPTGTIKGSVAGKSDSYNYLWLPSLSELGVMHPNDIINIKDPAAPYIYENNDSHEYKEGATFEYFKDEFKGVQTALGPFLTRSTDLINLLNPYVGTSLENSDDFNAYVVVTEPVKQLEDMGIDTSKEHTSYQYDLVTGEALRPEEDAAFDKYAITWATDDDPTRKQLIFGSYLDKTPFCFSICWH